MSSTRLSFLDDCYSRQYIGSKCFIMNDETLSIDLDPVVIFQISNVRRVPAVDGIALNYGFLQRSFQDILAFLGRRNTRTDSTTGVKG